MPKGHRIKINLCYLLILVPNVFMMHQVPGFYDASGPWFLHGVKVLLTASSCLILAKCPAVGKVIFTCSALLGRKKGLQSGDIV